MIRLLKINGIERMIGIPLIGLLVPFVIDHQDSLADYLRDVLATLCYCFALWQGNWYIIQRMRRRFSTYSDTYLRLIFQVSIAFLYTTVTSIGIAVLFDYLYSLPFKFPPREGALLLSFIITFFTISIYESVYFSARWKEMLIEAENLKNENLRSQLETLKGQLSPHFLFNTLNTLVTLIPEDQDEATRFVVKLSGVYRYILQIKDKQVVTLTEELEFVESYLYLMQARFSEALQISWEISPTAKADCIPPLSVQMLVENAIKHNIVSRHKPLYIHISTDTKANLLVKNNIQAKSIRHEEDNETTRVGLENIRKRYSFLTSRLVEVMQSGKEFMVSIPLLKPAEQMSPQKESMKSIQTKQ